MQTPGWFIGSRATTRRLLQVTCSRTTPRVNDVNVAVFEIRNIVRRELGASRLGNSRDLGISVADRSATRTAVSGNPGKDSRSVAVKAADPPPEILCEHGLGRRKQALAALAFCEQFDSVKDLCLGDRCGEKFGCGLFRNPRGDSGRGLGPHQLRKHIGVEDDHSPKWGGWRTASRRGSSSLTPPKAANR